MDNVFCQCVSPSILKQKISLDKSKISKQKISGGGILTHIPHPNCHTSTKSRFSSIYELKYKREKVQLMRRNSIKLRMGQEGEVL